MDASTHIETREPDRRKTASAAVSVRRHLDRAQGCRRTLPVRHDVEIFKKTSCVTGLKLAGRDVAQDMLEFASIPLLTNTSLDDHLLYGDCFAVTDKAAVETLKTVTWTPHQNASRSADKSLTIDGAAVGSGRSLTIAPPIFNAKLTDKELAVCPSKSNWRATNHTSGTMWNYARQAGAAVTGAAAGPGRAHEKQCYADV